MQTAEYPNGARDFDVAIEDCKLATRIDEVKLLCWLAKESNANVLEIGTHLGATTRALALAVGDGRIVFSVDYISDNPTMSPEQSQEMPTLETVGREARGLKNVFLAIQKSETFSYDGKNIGFVFIDGDHSYSGVMKDTELAMAACLEGKTSMPFTIAWHDVYDHCPWVFVKRYLLDRFGGSERFVVRQVDGTHVAVLTINR